MIEINNKFEIDDRCWTYAKHPIIVSSKCPICNGDKKLIYDGQILKCLRCRATGSIDEFIGEIYKPCEVTVRNIRITITKNDTSIRYVIDPITSDVKVKNRMEHMLCGSYDEVLKLCAELNENEREDADE